MLDYRESEEIAHHLRRLISDEHVRELREVLLELLHLHVHLGELRELPD